MRDISPQWLAAWRLRTRRLDQGKRAIYTQETNWCVSAAFAPIVAIPAFRSR